MDAATAAASAHRHIDRLGNLRHLAAVPELADLLSRHRYFAVYALGRTAPAHSGPEGTHALLALFPRSLVGKAFEWVGPDEVARLREAYLAACEELGERVHATVPDAEELAERLERLVRASDLANRPLAAVWADLPPPAGVGARVERAAAILREFRGGGHLAVLTTHGLVGPDALLLTAAWKEHDDLEGHARYFGWRDDDVSAAWSRLVAAGRVDAQHAATARGAEEREAIETLTNALAAQPWASVDDDDHERTIELLSAAGDAVRAAVS